MITMFVYKYNKMNWQQSPTIQPIYITPYAVPQIFPSPFPSAFLSHLNSKNATIHRHIKHRGKQKNKSINFITNTNANANIMNNSNSNRNKSKTNWCIGKVKKIQLGKCQGCFQDRNRSVMDKSRFVEEYHGDRDVGKERSEDQQHMYREKSMSIMCQRKLKARILQIIGGHTSGPNFNTLQRQNRLSSSSHTTKHSRSYMHYRVISRDKQKLEHQSHEQSLQKIRNICETKLINISSKSNRKQQIINADTSTFVKIYKYNGSDKDKIGDSRVGKRYRTEVGENRMGKKKDTLIYCPWEVQDEFEDTGLVL